MTQKKPVRRRRTNPTHIDDLLPDPKNARRHNPRNVGMIVESLKTVKAARSIVIDEHNQVLAGNATIEAAAEAGINRVRVVDTDGGEIIAVRRTGLTKAEKVQLAISDNRATDLSTFDGDIVREFSEEGIDLSTFFSEPELADLDGDRKPKTGKTDPDDVPEQRATNIKAGDLFQLGRHRLLCGDSTQATTAGRLMLKERAEMMVADPPYGVSYAAKNEFLNAIDAGKRNQTPISGDHQTPEQMSEFWVAAFSVMRCVVSPGAAYYVTGPQGADLLLLLQALNQAAFPLRHMLIWAKNNHVLGRCDYHYKHEPVIYGWVDGTHRFRGGKGETSLWEIDRPHGSKEHPTMKPVELWRRAIQNSSSPGDIVLDPFTGSGTAVLAAEQLDRRCYAIEIEPSYCQVTIDRWESFTGKKARKLGVVLRKTKRLAR